MVNGSIDAGPGHADAIYGAAVTACRDRDAAADVTVLVCAAAARESEPPPRRRLVERAILAAMRSAPARPFAAMAPGDREAVALARLAGYSEAEVADALGIEAGAVRARLLRGLRALAAARPVAAA